VNSENQVRLANTGLKKQISLLEERLLESERTEATLQDSEKRYRRLFESAKDGNAMKATVVETFGLWATAVLLFLNLFISLFEPKTASGQKVFYCKTF